MTDTLLIEVYLSFFQDHISNLGEILETSDGDPLFEDWGRQYIEPYQDLLVPVFQKLLPDLPPDGEESPGFSFEEWFTNAHPQERLDLMESTGKEIGTQERPVLISLEEAIQKSIYGD